jgi:mRNA interferase RelE/StbE
VPIRVELIDEAVDDLLRYAESGNLILFLKKLLRIEDVGAAAGQPLGRGLTTWRKIVVGDRNWRIIFTTDPEERVATVWVIGDRDDSACYTEATERVARIGKSNPQAATLASVLFQLSEMQRTTRKNARKRKS